MSSSLSEKMLNTIQRGKKCISSDARQRIASFVASQLTEEDAFADRSGKADIYYTAFGLMLAYIFEVNVSADKIMQWMDRNQTDISVLANQMAYLRVRMLCYCMKTAKWKLFINRLFGWQRQFPVFAYRDVPTGDNDSPYTQFMLMSFREESGMETENIDEIYNKLMQFRVESGGFSNIRGSSHAATNATVAALAITGQYAGYRNMNERDTAFLLSMQDACGGFFAAPDAPVPDLLSTATALFVLKYCGIKPRYRAADFIDAHWLSSGGFCGTLTDDIADVEYSAYGVLALGACF